MALLWYVQKVYEERNSEGVTALGSRIARDPYLLACLRGGTGELILVALVALLERGLLKAKGDKLKADGDAAGKARRPLDKAILGLYKKSGEGQAAFADAIVLSEAGKIHEELCGMQLVPNGGGKRFRIFSGGVAVGFLWFVAFRKIGIALERGHHNIGFLIMMVLCIPLVVMIMSAERTHTTRTRLGERVFSGVCGRFAGLGRRSSSLRFNGQTGEIAFYAAAFGLAGLPPAIASVIEPLDLAPPAPPPSSVGGAQGGGGSCGSTSCGSSCGGGCGGCG